MVIRSRSSKRKLQQEAPSHIVSKKLRSKIPRRRRNQISPVLLASAKFKISKENPRLSVDSSSGSDFAGGEVTCNSSRISSVFVGKGTTSSRNGEIGECVSLMINRRFEKRSENEVEVSENSCVDSNYNVRERNRSLILKFKSGKENDEASEVCTKSEITCADNSKSSNGNLNISARNDVVSVSSGARETSFEEEKRRITENRASESEFSSRNRHDDENCTDLIAQSIIKQCSDNSGSDSDLACREQLHFSSYDDESEYCSSQGTTSFSDLHSEIFGDCSDYSPSLFTDSGSQFSQGSVGETHSPMYSLFLQYREEFTTLATRVNNTSSVEEEVSINHNVRLISSISEFEITY